MTMNSHALTLTRVATLLLAAAAFAGLTACSTHTVTLRAADADGAALTWRIVELGYDAEAGVTTDQPRDGNGSLRIRTYTKDPGAWFAFARVAVERRDREPLGTLGQLVDGGSLTIDLFRHPDTGEGMPDFVLPWVALRVRNADGEEAVLLWESPYNGYSPFKKEESVVPEGVWLDNLPIHAGTFWIRYQNRNYNMGAGFKTLAEYANGHEVIIREKASLVLSPATQVMAVEIGSGANLTGLMLGFADDLRLIFNGGETYRYNFEN